MRPDDRRIRRDGPRPALRLIAADLTDRFPGRVERHSADLSKVMPGGAPDLEPGP